MKNVCCLYTSPSVSFWTFSLNNHSTKASKLKADFSLQNLAPFTKTMVHHLPFTIHHSLYQVNSSFSTNKRKITPLFYFVRILQLLLKRKVCISINNFERVPLQLTTSIKGISSMKSPKQSRKMQKNVFLILITYYSCRISIRSINLVDN